MKTGRPSVFQYSRSLVSEVLSGGLNKINPLSLDINHISILLTPYVNGNDYIINPNKKMELKYRLAKAKENIDIFVNNKKDKEEYYSKITNVLDQFSDYRKRLKRELGTKYITNAFLKCWEIGVWVIISKKNSCHGFLNS